MRVGGVVFNHRAEAVQSPTTDRRALRDGAARGHEAERRHGHRRGAGHVAGDADGPRRGPTAAARPARSCCSRTATSTDGRDPLPVAAEARRLGIPVYTVALGTAAGGPPQRRPRAARHGDAAGHRRALGRRRRSPPTQAGALDAVYERLGSQVATKREEREVTGAFAGGALLLLLAGGGLSLRWFRRLV